MKKIILLDRDGIINEDSSNYIKSIDEFTFLPGSVAAIVQLTQAGYKIGIATNQSGIARGYYSHDQLTAIHSNMCEKIRVAGGEIDAIEYCPHHPNEGCVCRKPKPTMLQRLAKRLDCDLDDVPFVGDKISDLLAAQAAGATPILIAEPRSDVDKVREQDYSDTPCFQSLAQFVMHYLKLDKFSPT